MVPLLLESKKPERKVERMDVLYPESTEIKQGTALLRSRPALRALLTGSETYPPAPSSIAGGTRAPDGSCWCEKPSGFRSDLLAFFTAATLQPWCPFNDFLGHWFSEGRRRHTTLVQRQAKKKTCYQLKHSFKDHPNSQTLDLIFNNRCLRHTHPCELKCQNKKILLVTIIQ